jgi:DNA binding domain, excisionase family
MVLTEEERARRPFTVEEAADFLKVHIHTVLKMIKDGKMKAGKVGREWRIAQDEIERLLKGE